jgi:hypothetical protein
LCIPPGSRPAVFANRRRSPIAAANSAQNRQDKFRPGRPSFHAGMRWARHRCAWRHGLE